MDRDAEFSACVDFMARRLSAMAVYELQLSETIYAFQAALKRIAQGNVSDRLAQAGIDIHDAVRDAVLDVMTTTQRPEGYTLQDWVDGELRNRTNPLRAHVIALLERLELQE